MRRLISLVVLCLSTSPAFAGGKDGKVVLELWDAAYLGEGKAGYVHTIAKEIDRDGKKLILTTVELRLTVKRFNDTVQMSMDTGSTETLDGKVVGVFLRQYLGKQQQMAIDGLVVGDEIRFTVNGDKPLTPNPWNDEVLGLFKQQSLYRDHDLKPGDTFSYLSFEPTINVVVKTGVTVKGFREVEIKGAKKKRKLLLVESIPEKIEYKRGPDKVEKIQLPISLTWLDEKLEPVKTEVEIPNLGPIVMYRTTKAEALAPGPIASLDIGYNQLVRLKNRVLNPHATTAAVFRITLRKYEDVASAFSEDDRQQVKKVQGNTFELHVKSNRGSMGEVAEKPPAAEFLQSSYFINSDDAKVKELARKAVGDATDPWKKALRIERWVHDHMRFTNDDNLATADHVAVTLTGDCSEYAMLTAAMCRAERVPSRTALGLVYAEVKSAPYFGFHMWTEVWIKGRWIPIDATLHQGFVGAMHLKITDHSWHDERTMTPIFPVIRVVGRVSIEVLSAENR